MHIGQTVMGCGGTVDYLVDAVFNYPTLAESYKVAALDAMNKLRELGRVSGAEPGRDRRPGVTARGLLRPAVPLAVMTVALAAPAAASAHVAGAVDYEFPLPVWMYVLGGALAVLVSVPAAMLATPGPDLLGRDWYRRIRPLHLGAIGTAVATVMLVAVVAGGFAGSDAFAENPATVVIWVDMWVGVGVVSALIANVWDFTSPLSAAARVLDRRLAGDGTTTVAYPPWLGMWPAVLLAMGWAWIELCWPEGEQASFVAFAVVVYVPVQVCLCALFGAEVWLPRGELFTAFARTLARIAPVELYVRDPHPGCPGAICREDAERVGCVACWLDADPSSRGVRFRLPGAGVHRESPLPAGGAAFVLALLGGVVFDGFRNTDAYFDLIGWILRHGPDSLATHSTTLRTIALLIVVGGFLALYLAVMAVVSSLEGDGILVGARRYAPALIPIAAVYFVAHYLTYLIIYAQFTPGVIADPFEREWVPGYGVWTDLPSGVVWWVQLLLIVIGHVMAVFEAHRIALDRGTPRVTATLRHAPLTALMIGYTAAGLWVLAQTAGG